ncbi:MAG: DUF5615 family PIN-like protein [Acidimicrobiales bacterium]
MRLLFDQNLSRHLVGHLRDAFPESEHVTALGLDAATDLQIWEHARARPGDRVEGLRLPATCVPPRGTTEGVWLKVGNASTATILQVLLDHAEAIESFGTNEDEALLVLPALTAPCLASGLGRVPKRWTGTEANWAVARMVTRSSEKRVPDRSSRRPLASPRVTS